MARPDSTDKMLDELLKSKTSEEILGEEGLLDNLTRRLVERALEGEMTHHLGYPPPDLRPASIPATRETARRTRRSRAGTVRWRSRFPATGTERSILNWFASIRGVFRGLMPRSWRSTPAG